MVDQNIVSDLNKQANEANLVGTVGEELPLQFQGKAVFTTSCWNRRSGNYGYDFQ